MNDKLQQIIDSSVISPCEEKVTISKEGFEWLIKKVENAQFCLAVIKGAMDDYSEQIEELEDELARWEAGLNQTKEMYELQRQLRQAQEKIEQQQQEFERLQGLADELNNELFSERMTIEKLEWQLQQAQAKAERYEKALKEIQGLSNYYIDDASINAIAKQALEETK
ncbi:hypothetical protein [Thermaerobacillus caldiproteolyticus]|uniref:hypothetical protein n=1 Tax=Thermaerobacillus caldiproteolyticus TaxID=247480 RepID=UPI0018F26150|nr:hypothetical protein [Anoxybacillus caldiproteolyticus]